MIDAVSVLILCIVNVFHLLSLTESATTFSPASSRARTWLPSRAVTTWKVNPPTRSFCMTCSSEILSNVSSSRQKNCDSALINHLLSLSGRCFGCVDVCARCDGLATYLHAWTCKERVDELGHLWHRHLCCASLLLLWAC